MKLESIDVTLGWIIFHEVPQWSKSGVPYLIARTSKGTVKGEMADPVLNGSYRLYGEWAVSKKTGKDEFEFFAFETTAERSPEGVIKYIETYVPEFGPSRARRLVELFGTDAIDVLRVDPDRARLVPGVTDRVVNAIREHFESSESSTNPYDFAAVYSLLADFHVPKKVVGAILTDFGSSAQAVIKENPYRLAAFQGVGFGTADKVAIQKVKYDPNGLHRYRAAVMEALRRVASEGDTYAEFITLKGHVDRLIGRTAGLDDAVASLAADGLVEVEGEGLRRVVADAALADAEREVAYRLKGLVDSWAGGVGNFSEEGLEGEQVNATRLLAENPVAILTGPPGTGKTYTSTNIIRSLRRENRAVALNTPTGKAAKRASEVLDRWLPRSGVDVSTIHRALACIGSRAGVGVPAKHAKFGRERKEFVPTKNECNYLNLDDAFIDEMSMVDVQLCATYLRAIPPGSRLSIVGDEHQLQSIQCGAVLRDLIAAGVPTARLTEPRRNSGLIVRACHAIKNGEVPSPAAELNPETGDNWFHIECSDMDEIARTVVELHSLTPRDPLWDVQVISPQNAKLPVGCANLNALLSRHFNPERHADASPDRFEVMDKVVRTENKFVQSAVPAAGGYEPGPPVYVVNGDLGQVLDVVEYKKRKYVIVKFMNPDRLAWLPYGEPNIVLAYAMTVHKCQGSGWPAVIFPVHNSIYSGLLTRELVYTAFSRAEEALITVGQMSAIRAAVGRKTSHQRKTRLERFVREAFNQ